MTPPKYNPNTPVIFRMMGREVIALFPTLPGDMNPRTCMSYMHVGQHGAASVDLGTTHRLAKRHEYAPLKRELEGLGYKLRVVTKIAPSHTQERREALNAAA